jgi:molybdenum cofactor synthesis domain-containing protein
MNPYPLTPFEKALDLVLQHTQRLDVEEVPFYGALGRVLAEDLYAAGPMPPFRASAMDGFAVIADDQAEWREIVGDQWAGPAAALAVAPDHAVRITTGAPLPPGADAVVPVENSHEDGGRVCFDRAVKSGDNVRPVGEDIAAGQLVLSTGAVIGPAEIGLLASMNRIRMPVYRRPIVAVLSTGNEIVEPGATIAPGQIRDSNRYTIMSSVVQAGGIPLSMGIVPDEESALRDAFRQGLQQADVFISSGGVSMGEHDLSRVLIEAWGTVHFGQVKQKPGRPTVFATVDRHEFVGRRLIFGLPGFPVASLVSFENLARPALRKMAGYTRLFRPTVEARLTHAIRRKGNRVEFQRARVEWHSGEWHATVTGLQTSGRLLSLAGANALLRLPIGIKQLEAGDTVTAIRIDQPEIAESDI